MPVPPPPPPERKLRDPYPNELAHFRRTGKGVPQLSSAHAEESSGNASVSSPAPAPAAASAPASTTPMDVAEAAAAADTTATATQQEQGNESDGSNYDPNEAVPVSEPVPTENTQEAPETAVAETAVAETPVVENPDAALNLEQTEHTTAPDTPPVETTTAQVSAESQIQSLPEPSAAPSETEKPTASEARD